MVIYTEDKRTDIEEILFEFKEDLFDKTISDEKLRNLAEKFADKAVFVCGGVKEGTN